MDWKAFLRAIFRLPFPDPEPRTKPAPAPAPSPPPPSWPPIFTPPSPAIGSAEDRLRVELVLARLRRDLGALSPDVRLAAAARGHAADMAFHRDLSHEGSDGSDLALRLARAGYPDDQPAGECLSSVPDPAEAVERWLDEPPPALHRRILTDPAITRVGVGLGVSPSGQRYWCVVVG